jgi:hypothetical protein
MTWRADETVRRAYCFYDLAAMGDAQLFAKPAQKTHL